MSREEKLRTILKTIDMSEYSDTKKNIDKPTCLIKTYKDFKIFGRLLIIQRKNMRIINHSSL